MKKIKSGIQWTFGMVFLMALAGCFSNDTPSPPNHDDPEVVPTISINSSVTWDSSNPTLITAGVCQAIKLDLTLTEIADGEILSFQNADNYIYSDANCTQQINSIPITDKSLTSVTVYTQTDSLFIINDPMLNEDTLMLFIASIESTSGTPLINSDPNYNLSLSQIVNINYLSWSANLTSGTVNNCLGPFTVQAANVTENTTTSVSSPSTSLSVFSDSGCSNSISTLAFDTNTSSQSFYVLDTASETASLSVSTLSTSLTYSNVYTSIAFSPATSGGPGTGGSGGAGGVANFVLTGNSGSAGSCQAVVISYTDSSNNPTALTTPIVVNISASASGSFGGVFTDSACSQAVSQSQDLMGNSVYPLNLTNGISYTFYVTDSAAETVGLTLVPASGIPTQATATVTFN